MTLQEGQKKIEDYVFSEINNGKSLSNIKYKDIERIYQEEVK